MSNLAEITDDEQNQIRMSLTSRPDRKQAVRFLASKGLSTSDIAEQTGWKQRTIQRDLAEIEAVRRQMSLESATNDAPAKPSATGSPETIARREEVTQAAASEGETDAPAEQYRIIYADPPWGYGAHAQPDYQTERRDHYPVMPLEDICALPVNEWARGNAGWERQPRVKRVCL